MVAGTGSVTSSDCDLAVIDALYAKAVEASPDAVIIVNADRVMLIVNQQAEFLFGYARSELLGQPIDILLPEGLRDRHIKHVAGFFEEPRMRDMGPGRELIGRKRNGHQFHVNVKLAPLIVANAGLHVMAVVRRAYSTNGNGLVKESP